MKTAAFLLDLKHWTSLDHKSVTRFVSKKAKRRLQGLYL